MAILKNRYFYLTLFPSILILPFIVAGILISINQYKKSHPNPPTPEESAKYQKWDEDNRKFWAAQKEKEEKEAKKKKQLDEKRAAYKNAIVQSDVPESNKRYIQSLITQVLAERHLGDINGLVIGKPVKVNVLRKPYPSLTEIEKHVGQALISLPEGERIYVEEIPGVVKYIKHDDAIYNDSCRPKSSNLHMFTSWEWKGKQHYIFQAGFDKEGKLVKLATEENNSPIDTVCRKVEDSN